VQGDLHGQSGRVGTDVVWRFHALHWGTCIGGTVASSWNTGAARAAVVNREEKGRTVQKQPLPSHKKDPIPATRSVPRRHGAAPIWQLFGTRCMPPPSRAQLAPSEREEDLFEWIREGGSSLGAVLCLPLVLGRGGPGSVIYGRRTEPFGASKASASASASTLTLTRLGLHSVLCMPLDSLLTLRLPTAAAD
jgi:hypothetical protein